MSGTAIGIVGTDGHTPIQNELSGFKMFSIHEIYLGFEGQNKYIPNVNDWVVEPETGKMWRVATLSPITFIPELAPIQVQRDVTVDEIVADSPTNYKLYYDTSIFPHTLTVDGFLHINSEAATTARIYRGEFVDPARIISRRYNNSGVYVGHDIPLTLTAFNTLTNLAIKSVPTCNTDQTLLNGDTCTLVIYDSAGKVRGRAPLVVDNTTFISQSYAEQKYIVNIYMKSAFISDSSASDVDYPVNLPLASFSPIGVVQYNDGTEVEYPIDGDKFTLDGLNSAMSTIVGHSAPLVLRYRLSSNESGVASVAVDGHFISRPYRLRVSAPNTSYNVKLFAYPVWIDTNSGYTLRVYLTNLDRSMIYDVTHIAGLATNSPSFNPTAYGLTQRLTYALNLSTVSGVYNNFIHVQAIDVILRAPAYDGAISNIWEVASQVPSPTAYYGTNIRATVDAPTQRKLSIGNNLPTVTEFINKVYKTTHPLFNPVVETSAPTPTHIEVRHGGESVIIDIQNYQTPVQLQNPVPPLATVDLVFLRQTTSGYLKLSVAAMTVR